MHTIVVYSAVTTPRLSHVLDWLLTERLQLSYVITNEDNLNQPGLHIAYGKNINSVFSIPAHGLLHEQGVNKIAPNPGKWGELPVIFAANNNNNIYSLPFDIFSAIFYLLSRYEEYYAFKPDKHGRYPAMESVLYQYQLLERPIVDEWVWAFRKTLMKELSIEITPPTYKFQPTYDIDIAYYHIFKGIKRIAGAYLKAILKGDLQQIAERTQILKKKKQDPFDSFGWMRNLHQKHNIKPLYFVLCALRRSAFDKNISPRHPAMIRVMKQLAKEAITGIHPSYYATKYDIIAKEKKILESITGQPVEISRQHYIRLHIPSTYRLLIDNQIKDDYSMGYGALFGFRAGTGASFLWYDLENEKTSSLRIHPFCFMDTTAHYEAGLSPKAAFAKLNELAQKLEQTGSTLITIFHNFSLGTAREWEGWKAEYAKFLEEQSKG